MKEQSAVSEEIEEEEDDEEKIEDVPDVPDLPPVVFEFAEKAKEVRRIHKELYSSMTDLISAMKSKPVQLTDEELADIGYLLRNTAKVLNDLRIECNAKKDYIGKYLCAKLVIESVNDSEELKIKGMLASAAAKMDQKPKLPKTGTKEYAIMLKHFGVSDEAIKAGIFNAHYPRVGEYITRLAQNGKNPPPGILNVVTLWTCVFRSRTRKKRNG